MIKRETFISASQLTSKLFDEARSKSGTWSSVTINNLSNYQKLFSEEDVKNVVDLGIQMIVDDKEEPTTKFKLAQLFSQLYNMKFPYFNMAFKIYIEEIQDYIEKPQSSYLWKPTVNLLSTIVFHLRQI